MTLTTASLNGRAQTGVVTDDDIDPAARPTRRSFTAEYKAEIVEVAKVLLNVSRICSVRWRHIAPVR